ncbi:unnamed protein product [Schistosoma margrebowiei]|uniref:Uncharacterized protein n=1 Tax=Schistosoma margrebowiei TaxID=48269 RepID=A0A183LJQ4_9TREM|nr:unnamed protein product [Schistosoma margrebowiei]
MSLLTTRATIYLGTWNVRTMWDTGRAVQIAVFQTVGLIDSIVHLITYLKIKLKTIINNQIYHENNNNFIKDLSFHSLIPYSQLHNFESMTFSLDYENDMNKNDYHCSQHVVMNTDTLKCINQCLLITDQSKYQFISGIKYRVYWYQLAKSEEFLKCLIEIIPTGYGDPYFQEIAMIVLTNICILAGYKTK